MSEVLSYANEPKPALFEHAEGLERAEAMKRVIGPALDSYLRPVYDVDMTEKEVSELSRITDFKTIGNDYLIVCLQRSDSIINDAVTERLHQLRDDNPQAYDQLRKTAQHRPDLFHYATQGIEPVLQEGVRSGIIIPINLASNIYRAENGNRLSIYEKGLREIVEIAERDNFDEILFSLTKGPNGFLERGSLSVASNSDEFFSFSVPGRAQYLRAKDTFRIEGGRVVSLSDAYHIAANARRQTINATARRVNLGKFSPPNPQHRAALSSGCPVRHSFEDETGEEQEPLVVTAKKFVVAALKVAAAKEENLPELP